MGKSGKVIASSKNPVKPRQKAENESEISFDLLTKSDEIFRDCSLYQNKLNCRFRFLKIKTKV